ncbi:cytoplasmic protein [Lichtheimia corymbifera JMRC:FSU:9682]|uniref:Cytoplasmic protein n=1 Tax=Lichtheimia corymbifera JMRC:FSU:9682 TaxID=1263082 RepID=A0A068RE47_9FUNG|nr:cytoplasmic protein [Lichtheimia corymbifera JMRC:FSU:9682]
MEAPVPSSGLYTCLACQVAFESADGQRIHYRSDWHRYNLKRKVADLPPVTLEQFQQKQKAVKEADAPENKPEPFKGHCSACKKTFGTQNSYDSHMRSKKHKENVAKEAARPKKTSSPASDKQDEKTPTTTTHDDASSSSAPISKPPAYMPMSMTFTEDMTEEEINAKIDEKIKMARRLGETECLFCNHNADTFEDNMQHMTIQHSFFIPDIEYLVDLKGLIKYLGEKLSIGNTCLYCNGKGRELRSLEAVRKHMIDKGHCKIAYEADEDAMELVDFYDFSSSYPELEGEDEDADSELANMTRKVRLADDDMSLVLPSGAVIGHRDLKRYYNQRFKPEDTRESVLINKLIGQYTDMPGYETARSSSSSQRRRLAITDGKAQHVRHTEAFKEMRVHEDHKSRVGIKANKLQKYFRVQIL